MQFCHFALPICPFSTSLRVHARTMRYTYIIIYMACPVASITKLPDKNRNIPDFLQKYLHISKKSSTFAAKMVIV